MTTEVSHLHPFVRALASLRFEQCFNPYREFCQVHDRKDAPHRRALLLSAILGAAESRGVDSIWIGRDLGYRGGRRTGLAFTDDVHVQKHANRWDVSSALATNGLPESERTATVVWSVLDTIRENVFLWNVFPLHPFELDEPFSNRQHNSRERRAGVEVLRELVARLRPARIVAVGNDAADAARTLNLSIPLVPVRHPSYGGQNQFVSQMAVLYGRRIAKQRDLL